jgi:hypothetical protein
VINRGRRLGVTATGTQHPAAGYKVRQRKPFPKQVEKELRIPDAGKALADLAALNANGLAALERNRKWP